MGTDELPDAEVVARVLAGERDLFAVLVRRHGDGLYRHAERMVGRPDDAADLVQRAFIKGYRGLGRCQPDQVGGWLFRILSNLCLDHLRDPRRDQMELEAVAPRPDPGPGPEEALDRAELGRRLDGALARLTPEQREAFVLKHHEGYSYEEMSDLMGVSPAALKMRVHRARASLRALLEEEP